MVPHKNTHLYRPKTSGYPSSLHRPAGQLSAAKGTPVRLPSFVFTSHSWKKRSKSCHKKGIRSGCEDGWTTRYIISRVYTENESWNLIRLPFGKVYFQGLCWFYRGNSDVLIQWWFIMVKTHKKCHLEHFKENQIQHLQLAVMENLIPKTSINWLNSD